MKLSKCKLGNFNSCPGKDAFLDLFDESAIKVKFIDIGGSWKNDESTAVLTFNYKGSSERWANFMESICSIHPDSVDWTYVGKKNRIVFRLWWD